MMTLLNDKLDLPKNYQVDDYINISKYSTDILGKELSYGYPFSFNTVFGKAGNVRAAMDYIVTPNYPKELLSKKVLTVSDVNSLPKKQLNVVNFWAIVVYILCERIKQDKELIEKIKNNQLGYISYNIKDVKYLDQKKQVIMINDNRKMNIYTSIIKHIDTLIKEDRFNNKNIEAFIEDCKRDKNVDLFHGSVVTCKVKDE